MLYRDSAGNEEWIWNSRDGVTPFIVRSRQGLSSQHVDWKRDRFLPYHVPAVGDRIFVTTTPERAREQAESWYETWSKDPEHGPYFCWHWPYRSNAVEWQAAKILSWMGGESPELIEVTEEILEQLLNRPALVLASGHQRAALLQQVEQANMEAIASTSKLGLEQLQRELADENAKLAMIASTKAEDVTELTDPRLVLEAQCRDLGRLILQQLPTGTGFTLLLYDFGSDGNLAYVSSGKREDCLKMMR